MKKILVIASIILIAIFMKGCIKTTIKRVNIERNFIQHCEETNQSQCEWNFNKYLKNNNLVQTYYDFDF